MAETAPISLQINLAPTDLPTARHTLPHQLRQWAGQVDEIVLTLDLHRSRGRYAAAWDERLPGMRELLAGTCARYPTARTVEVDYTEEARSRVAGVFFGGRRIPEKDYNGAPFYAYLFGMEAASHDLILHMDSDMLYGGGSQTWASEAVRMLASRPNALACNPLPGPPTADGALRSQTLDPFPYTSLAYQTTRLSTRIFLMDRARLLRLVPALPLLPPPSRARALQARLDGNPPVSTMEDTFSHEMTRLGLLRVDFLGDPPGMWSVHPPYRTAEFYERLPELIGAIESGAVPEGQRGMHDMTDSMVDWSSARIPRWRRLARHAGLALSRALPAGQTGSR